MVNSGKDYLAFNSISLLFFFLFDVRGYFKRLSISQAS